MKSMFPLANDLKIDKNLLFEYNIGLYEKVQHAGGWDTHHLHQHLWLNHCQHLSPDLYRIDYGCSAHYFSGCLYLGKEIKSIGRYMRARKLSYVCVDHSILNLLHYHWLRIAGLSQ